MQHTTPDSLEIEGKEAFERRNYLDAEQAFSKAAEIYAARGEEMKSAEMRSNQSVALLRAKKPAQALDVISGVSAVFADFGDIQRQGMALGNQGSILSALKRVHEAVGCYEEAAELFQTVKDDENLLIVKRQAAALFASRLKFIDALLTIRDGYLGLNNPTWGQRVIKKLLFIGS